MLASWAAFSGREEGDSMSESPRKSLMMLLWLAILVVIWTLFGLTGSGFTL